MKSSTIIFILTQAAANVMAQTSGGPCSLSGSNDGRIVCCSSAIETLCSVAIVGSECTGNQRVYCCLNDAMVSHLAISLLRPFSSY